MGQEKRGEEERWDKRGEEERCVKRGEKRREEEDFLMAAIIFISMGVIASFFCAIVDGIIAAEFIVMCNSFNSECKVRVKSNTCYCCDLFNCESPDYHTQYYEFTGVSSCWDVVHLYRLLWACVTLNIMGLFLGIITAAILGAYKDLAPAPQMSPSPAPPPHIMCNPTQHVVTYAGFCPNRQALPAYPNYPALPMQESQSQPSSQAPSQPTSQTGPQDPGQGYMLTPNAPALYPGPVYGPSGFEKPPPYAC
ncbi:unnamed protein product [Coregonus sp. 'balchen']|nr:unnamed protein product [Coregonus sp. 'balchen']